MGSFEFSLPEFRSRYVNHAPKLFEWSQQLVSGQLTLDSLLASAQFQKVADAVCDTTRHSDTNILNIIKSVMIMELDPTSKLVTDAMMTSLVVFSFAHPVPGPISRR